MEEYDENSALDYRDHLHHRLARRDRRAQADLLNPAHAAAGGHSDFQNPLSIFLMFFASG
ncbi:MAG TPA: hypothetical protein VJ652_06515 [Noviherbaspirillum sp.]|nr:hypothetical protein [Noviherbaspirillum sp.]